MTSAPFQHLDLADRRRVLAAGDIHGRFDLLETQLEDLEFDPAQDVLILLGDLVDRGERSSDALDWCDRSGVFRVRGNHEWLVHAATAFSGFGRSMHIRNGGDWFAEIEDPAERIRWAETLNAAPIAIEAVTPAGRRVGFVHADVPAQSWQDMVAGLAGSDPDEKHSLAYDCMWGRARFDDFRRHEVYGALAEFDCSVVGIDHVFFGHSIVTKASTHGNCSWIDTGAYRRGELTIVDVDEWIARARSE